MSHNNQKKVALINDFTGFGRCSIAVELPIISKLKVQCCPVPTSVFSNHTGFESFYMEDLTCGMEQFALEWKKLDLRFNVISTGFLGSIDQIETVTQFIKSFKHKGTVVVVDPVMGDYGKSYPTYTKELCASMRFLVCKANIITPNLTEACILTGTDYRESYNDSELLGIAQKLNRLGPQKIVITGLEKGSYIRNLCYENIDGKEKWCFVNSRKTGPVRSGTGDVFAAVISADAANGVDFVKSVKRACRFINLCLKASMRRDIPLTDGVCFEDVLYRLK